jgi:hypothetical protein
MSDRETFGIPGNRPLVSNAADPIPRKRRDEVLLLIIAAIILILATMH